MWAVLRFFDGDEIGDGLLRLSETAAICTGGCPDACRQEPGRLEFELAFSALPSIGCYPICIITGERIKLTDGIAFISSSVVQHNTVTQSLLGRSIVTWSRIVPRDDLGSEDTWLRLGY
jgi:hypothetical protein